jgi:hypothetical protein
VRERRRGGALVAAALLVAAAGAAGAAEPAKEPVPEPPPAGPTGAASPGGPAPDRAAAGAAPEGATGFLPRLYEAGAKLRDLGVKGDVTYKNFTFFRDVPNDKRTNGIEGIMHLQLDRQITDWWRMSFRGEARQDNRDFTKGYEIRIPDNLLRRRILDIMESYWKFTLPGEAEFTVGKLIYTWGKGDFYSPTDNMSPYDYLDVIDRLKLPVYSAELDKSFDTPAGPVDVSAIYIPFFTPARNPLENSRWTPVGAPTPGVGESVPTGAQTSQRVTPGRDPNNAQYAVRAKTTVGKVDVSLSYFYGWEYLPVVRVNRDGPNTIFIPVYRHMQVPGADFETTLDRFVLKGEAALKFGDRELKDSRFQGMLGARYTRDDVWTDWLKKLMVDFQYNRQEFISSQNPQYIVTGSFLNGFRNSGSGGLEFEFNPDRTFNRETKFRVVGSMDWSQRLNTWYQYLLTVKPVEDWLVETGFDTFSGKQTTFWGEWRNNDRFFLKITRLF